MNSRLKVSQLKEGMKLFDEKLRKALQVQTIKETKTSFVFLETHRVQTFQLDSRFPSVILKDLWPFEWIHLKTGNQYHVLDYDAQIKMPDSRWVEAVIYTDGERHKETGKPNRQFVRLVEDFESKFRRVVIS